MSFWGLRVRHWSCAVEFTHYGEPTGALTTIALSEFAENWLEGVNMCLDDTCEIISQSDHPFPLLIRYLGRSG